MQSIHHLNTFGSALRNAVLPPAHPVDSAEMLLLARFFQFLTPTLMGVLAIAATSNFILGEFGSAALVLILIAGIAVLTAEGRAGRQRLAMTLLPPFVVAMALTTMVLRDGVHDVAAVIVAAAIL